MPEEHRIVVLPPHQKFGRFRHQLGLFLRLESSNPNLSNIPWKISTNLSSQFYRPLSWSVSTRASKSRCPQPQSSRVHSCPLRHQVRLRAPPFLKPLCCCCSEERKRRTLLLFLRPPSSSAATNPNTST
uniref:Uncharacterized protein n=1 Tax=Physcomitrium patens TaxID=3218 RepID=A0A2K1KBI3_PHYPA|nr:hypothetical protein PHYPA_010317 [Physcomitrium patens]